MQIVLAGGKFGGTMILDSFFTVGTLGHDMAAYPDNILSPDDFRGFWIRSSGHKTEVGRENEVQVSNILTILQRSLIPQFLLM